MTPVRSYARRLQTIAIVVFLLPALARAVINAGLQPVDLFARYKSVLACEVVSADPAAFSFTMKVTRSYKGKHEAGQTIAMKAEGEILESLKAGAMKLPAVGDPAVVFAGKDSRRGAKAVLLYYGMAFSIGRMSAEGPWNWYKGDSDDVAGTDGRKIPTLAGTWCGSTPQLIRLLDEIAAKRAHFPRKAYVQFKPDMLLDKFDESPVRGVALYDIDGDGDLDVYACCDDGDRVYLQMEPLVFVNATDWTGLDCASPSCSFADVNADGRADLLAGGELRLGVLHEGRPAFKRTELLPYEATTDLLASAFVELNGDGYPDVVASKKKGGLQVFLNPGAKGGAFLDATKQMGLARPECGSGQTGFFAPGDWNGDGRTDLFYSAGKGFLLVQNAENRFAPITHDSPLRFAVSEDESPTGAGCFADIMGTGRHDLIVPVRDGWRLIENRKQVPVDMTDYGNEISEGSDRHVSAAISDLNMDGHVDFYTTSAAPSGPNRYIINRGFGSFMLASVHKHYEHVFKGPALERGGWGVATGDVNDDGYPDLLFGNLHGELYLVLNDTAAQRKPKDHPTDDEQKLLGTRIVSIRVTGATGVLGTRLTVEGPDGRIVARRDIGGNVVCGCRSPDTLDIAIRESGPCTLKVRYADGHERTQKLDVSKPERQKIRITRD